ncbi:MAG: sodium:solute symporter [Sphingomonadaceae bacterium]|nr:sodium:solute symporter [Sphingomonadaceae bacterium]
MELRFTIWDWGIVATYAMALALAGWWASRKQVTNAEGYFLASHHVPTWLVVISVLSTTQSAATFLGVPDNSYRSDFSYLSTNIGALIAALFVGHFLMPRFHQMGVTTVYELLDARYGGMARRAAAAMYLLGRILASGARLYLAAIAVSMIIFLDVSASHIAVASLILILFGLAFTLWGGLNAVVWSDLVQVILYVGAALLVLIWMATSLPMDMAGAWQILTHASDAGGASINKLRLFDWSGDFSHPFSMLAVVTGLTLLNIGNFGLDQDTSQRFLACADARQARRALILSALATIPVVLIFLVIGSLLYLHYAGGDAAAAHFSGEKITIFMAYILSEMPPGLRGLVTVGVLAAAAINSGLIAMSAVAVSDFYRPWLERRGTVRDAGHYVLAARIAVILLALALLAMAVLCYAWQRYADTPLLEFVLGVMGFAYSGLLGVYGAALFTRRGSGASVVGALVTGFVVTLVQQPFFVDWAGLPPILKVAAFPWQLCLGTMAAFLVTIIGKTPAQCPLARTAQ